MIATPLRASSWRRWPWWLLLPLACHWGFSWIGFSPTDDGWLQAVARRLLDGEVPHRDFIFVRPALSAVLQVPLTALGGEQVIWLSRLWGWLTIAVLCWLWTGLVGAAGLTRHLLYGVMVLLTAHTFPVMAWHTLDGLLFCTLAIVAATRERRTLAFVLVGCAALCRQNFAFFAPLLLLGVGGRWPSWVTAGFWSALPSVLYAFAIAGAGGGPDFFAQVLSVRGALVDTAFKGVVYQPWWHWGLLAGAALLAGARLSRRAPLWLVVPLAAAGLAYLLWRGPRLFQMGTFALFGACLVLAAGRGDRLLKIGALGVAWVAMISLGYNNPALAAGILFALLWRLMRAQGQPSPESTASPREALALAASVALVAAAFGHARLTFPYRDAAAPHLQWDAGEALPGATGLRTNGLTVATLAELRELTLDRETRGVRYAILTDVSAHWILSRQPNPLPCDWPQETELGYSVDLHERMLRALAALPPGGEILVQKYAIAHYAVAMEPISLRWNYYFVQNWVRTHCEKKGEGRFYEIYGKPAAFPLPARPAG
jgi:hypothetical protein